MESLQPPTTRCAASRAEAGDAGVAHRADDGGTVRSSGMRCAHFQPACGGEHFDGQDVGQPVLGRYPGDSYDHRVSVGMPSVHR